MLPLERLIPTEGELQLVNVILGTINHGHSSVVDLHSLNVVLTTGGISWSVLKEIWALIDRRGLGSITRIGLVAAIRLIGWAQSGKQVEEELIIKPGPLPKLMNITNATQRLHSQGPSSLAQLVSSVMPRDEKVESVFEFNYNDAFKVAFDLGKPQNSLLSRATALDIFTSKYKVPYSYVAQVFDLIDFSSRAALDIQEFCLGMHILQAFESNASVVLPSTIPIAIEGQLLNIQSQLMQYGCARPTPDRVLQSNHITPPITLIDPESRTWTSTKDFIDTTPLSVELDDMLKLLRNDLQTMGSIGGGLMVELNSRYKISPAVLAQAWAATPRHNIKPVPLDVIETMIQKVCRMLNACINCTDNASCPVTLNDFEFSTSNNSNIDPSRFSCTDNDEGAHTDSSSTSSTKWSMRPRGSYSGSCASCSQHLSEQMKKQVQPRSDFLKPSDIPAGSQYFMEEIQSLKSQLQEAKQQRRRDKVAMKSQIRRHFTDKIDRTAFELEQKTAEYQSSQAYLDGLRMDAQTFKVQRDRLQELVDIQNDEIANLRAKQSDPETTLFLAVEEPIESLRSSVARSQAQIIQIGWDTSRLLDLVASQKEELSKLHATTSSIERSVNRLMTRDENLHGLEREVHTMLIEQLINELKVRVQQEYSTGEGPQGSRRQSLSSMLELESDSVLERDRDDASTAWSTSPTEANQDDNTLWAVPFLEPPSSPKPVKGILSRKSLLIPPNNHQTSSAPAKRVTFDTTVINTGSESESESLALASRPPAYVSGTTSEGGTTQYSSNDFGETVYYEPLRRAAVYPETSPKLKGNLFQKCRNKIGRRFGRDTKNETENSAEEILIPENYTIRPTRHRLLSRYNPPSYTEALVSINDLDNLRENKLAME